MESVLYGIKWGHSLAGIAECPTSHLLVKSSLEGARRKPARPVQPKCKEPLSVDTVCRIADHCISSSSLAVIRFLFILLVGFAGFYRMEEIRHLSVKDVSICSEYMLLFIPKRKNDQYRQGHTSLLARSHKATCPVSFTERLLKLLPSSSHLPPSLHELLNLSLRSIFMLLKAFHTRRLERNLGNTLNHLWMTLLVTARIVSSLAPLQILRVGEFLLICWTCTPAGNMPFQRTDTLGKLLLIA